MQRINSVENFLHNFCCHCTFLSKKYITISGIIFFSLELIKLIIGK